MDVNIPDRHPSQPPLSGRPLRHPIASAALAAALVVCIYHIPGASVAADALRATLAGLACGALLAWAGRDSGRSGDMENANTMARAARAGRRGRSGNGRVPLAVVLGLITCALAGCVANALVGQGANEAVWVQPDLEVLGVLALSCLGTAAWEEILFRRLLPAAFAPQLPSGRWRNLACACICAGLFALLHLDASLDGMLAVARFVQVTLFGIVMAGMVRGQGGLAWAIALHAGYDLISFTWSVGTTGARAAGTTGLLGVPAETLLAGIVAPAGLAANIAVLVPLAAWAVWELGHGDVVFNSPGGTNRPAPGAPAA